MPKINTKIDLSPDSDPQWYKDAVIYQLHVKSFFDDNGDGMGDFKGLTRKLDYLQDLGVTAVWLLPFYPSPQKDDGYDISDYKSIHPLYGTLGDFRNFLRKAHKRGIRVITELVVNHTSDQHPWFQRARHSPPRSRYRDWYVWSDTPDRYAETRIIFQDFETSNWTWDPVAGAYYWHRFYSHQPDLNYDNPQVQKAIFNALDFWMNQGVDGFRMDAVPYLFEREGTNCENLPETHEFIKKVRAHVDKHYPGRMLLAEANQWPEDAAAYFGNGDEFHMSFHFPLMPRLYMALQMEDSFPILDILEQTPDIPESAQWAVFLRNHDELTLEMVTDEERDYMYRVYAQDPKMRLNLGIRRRLAPLLGRHRRRIELMNALLFSMPGTPIIYYGDEIAMGDNIHLGDRDGVRTPMQWSSDRNAGFSKANPQALFLPVNISPEYHFEVINVEVQQQNLHSELWWMKRIIKLRKQFKAFSRGSIAFLRPENHQILAFIRSYKDENILVVVNLSRFAQYAELDLSAYQGQTPVELFGRTPFPDIDDKLYFLTLGPHSFYWFYLTPPASEGDTASPAVKDKLPEFNISGKITDVFRFPEKRRLESILSAYIQTTRWFGGKGSYVKQVLITEEIPVERRHPPGIILILQVDYTHKDSETYVLPISFSEAGRAEDVMSHNRWATIAWVRHTAGGQRYLMQDGMADPDFCMTMLRMLYRRQRLKIGTRTLTAAITPEFDATRKYLAEEMAVSVNASEQSNTSVLFGHKFILKLIRRLTPGRNPDLEIGRFLTEKKFPHTPHLLGAMEIQAPRAPSTTLSLLHEYTQNQGDAWQYTLSHLDSFFESALAQRERFNDFLAHDPPVLELMPEPFPGDLFELIGSYLESARLLGLRTAELHTVLADAPQTVPVLRPEPFTQLYQRSLYQSLRAQAIRTFHLLNRNIDRLDPQFKADALAVKEKEKTIFNHFKLLLNHKITALRIRCHGDYHLGQVLYTGKDFKIIDFEGEPARPVSERAIKRCALRDVAGMLRSFHYAAYSAYFSLKHRGMAEPLDDIFLQSCARRWYQWVCLIFLKAYENEARKGDFLPDNLNEFKMLIDIFLLDKAIYELAYELNNRPDWVNIPLKGLLDLADQAI